ncbi:hypothetical protein BCV72DRAFT_233037 [Rhizopus microsporus var. microsporus]|uniref:Uncharacterized protein n=1 Tax=Rhizopus microsporus var. microsporus TaxID=86635 RepID=A0A1X0QUQ0_RHIZD|nr:hypothetical protein BCV72DRAFT_233037 [Rhizopus microsporus var. microsporus]
MNSLLQVGSLIALNPFVALGLFLTSHATDINDIACPNDPTVQYLYTLALQKHQSWFGDQHIADILAQVLETRYHKHTKILELINNNSSSEVVVKAIKSLQNQNQAIKSKYSEMNADSSCTPSISSTTTNIENIEFTSETATSHERGMMFVENYKQTRCKKNLSVWIGQRAT